MGIICGNTGNWQEIECLLCKCQHNSESNKTARVIPQSVFDSKEAIMAAKKGHAEAVRELNNMPRHLLDEGNPNHPRYDLHIFGEHYSSFMDRQYK